jgi:hypothetical protein
MGEIAEPRGDLPRRVGVVALRVLASLAVAAAALFWLLFAALLLGLRCGDGCSSPEDSERWQYVGQFGIAAVGVLCCAVGLTLRFTRHRRLSWILLGGGALTVVVWWTFVQSSSL